MAITINKLKNIGAEVLDIDLTPPIDNHTFARVRDAFYEHSVLVFHDQNLDDETHIAFSKRFGSLEPSMVNDHTGGGGPINTFSNVDANGRIIPPDDSRMLYSAGNMLWHSDSSYKKVPSRASLLFACEIPPQGGETEYAGMKAAYAALPEEKKAGLEGLVAEHNLAHSRKQIAPNLMSQTFKDEVPPVPQALVRTLPETGEKTLFVGAHASHILGRPVEEGRALMKELLEWTTQPRFVYHHRWRPKDLVVWDNRCCLHRGRPWDAAKHRRIMRRTTIAGDGPTA